MTPAIDSISRARRVRSLVAQALEELHRLQGQEDELGQAGLEDTAAGLRQAVAVLDELVDRRAVDRLRHLAADHLTGDEDQDALGAVHFAISNISRRLTQEQRCCRLQGCDRPRKAAVALCEDHQAELRNTGEIQEVAR